MLPFQRHAIAVRFLARQRIPNAFRTRRRPAGHAKSSQVPRAITVGARKDEYLLVDGATHLTLRIDRRLVEDTRGGAV